MHLISRGLAFLLLLVCLVVQAAPTDPELQRLLGERESLVKDYTFYNAQNSNFWGKKSKKDLLNIIETLKGIIKKDTEIIQHVSTLSLQKEAELAVQSQKVETQVLGGRLALQDRVHELNQEVASLRNLTKSRQRRIGELEEQLTETRQAKYEHDRIAIIAIVAGVMMLGYIFYLRSRHLRTKKQ